jgi:hypothetical protein
MIRSTIVCLLLAVSIAVAFPAAENDQAAKAAGGCPGGYAEGAEIERGRLVFICQGSQVVPKGCIAEDLSRLSVGGNYDTKQYRKKCQLGADGQLAYELVGCVSNGQEHKVGDVWDDGKNFYTCKSDGNSLKIKNQGCVDAGKRVNLKEKINKDDAVYSCEEIENGGSKLIPAGCVKDGKQFNVGDSFEDGKFWYNCTRTGYEKVVAKAAGCVSNGKRLNDGDRFNDNEVFIECTIDGGKPDVRTVACAQKDEAGGVVERKLGCTWVEGAEPLQYEWQCQPNADSAKKVQVRCNYKVGGGVYNVDPGCFRTIDKGFAGCVKEGNTLKLQLFDGEQAASGAGLHAC